MGTTIQADLSIFLIICGILGMLLLAIGISVFVLMYQKRMIFQKHQLQLLKIDYQKELLFHAIQAQEMERQRIATELHDGIGGMLSASKLYLNHLFISKNETEKENIQVEVKQMLDEVLENIRFISRDLIPPSLEKLGLVFSLQALSTKVNQSGELTIDFSWENTKRFDSQRELALYRISQELIQNTIKYAQATTIHLELHFTEDNLSYKYKDNGIGFDMEAKRATGLGIKNIESRAIFLDAAINYQSIPQKGTALNLLINL